MNVKTFTAGSSMENKLHMENGYIALMENKLLHSPDDAKILKELPNLAVCSSEYDPATALPVKCTAPHTRFIDGAYTDQFGLALMIGTMQKRFPNQKLRFIVNEFSTNVHFESRDLSVEVYFSDSSYSNPNDKTTVAPGEATKTWWPNMTVPLAQIFTNPWAEVKNSWTTVPHSKVKYDKIGAFEIKYTVAKVTTVENRYYSTEAGTEVELLIFQLSNNVPIWIPYTDSQTERHDQMGWYTKLAKQCASEEVTKIVKEFITNSR